MEKLDILLVVGEAGVGKSAVGEMIAKNKGYTYIDKDTATITLTEQYLAACSPTQNMHDRDSEFYLTQVRPLEYKTILALAQENLRLGNSVVITAGFESEMQMVDYLTVDPQMQAILQVANLTVVMVTVDRQTLLNRLILRNELRDKWKLDNWNAYLEQVKNMRIMWPQEQFKELNFDNSDALPILYDIKVNNLIKSI